MATLYKNISTFKIHHSSHVTFGEVWYDPEGGYARIQPQYQLLLVNLGEAQVSLPDKSFLIPTGFVGLMLPGCREIVHFSRKHRTHHTWCAFKVKSVPGPLKKRLAQLPPVLPQSPTLDYIMKAAFDIRSWRKKAAKQVLNSLGFALIDEYIRIAETRDGTAHEESPVERARLYLEGHSNRHDCMSSAVRASGVTVQRLIQLFHKHHQITPSRYLWQFRIERGAALLHSTGLNISEIAYRCGFKNPFHFSRMFRKMQGIAPREFRRQAWSRTE